MLLALMVSAILAQSAFFTLTIRTRYAGYGWRAREQSFLFPLSLTFLAFSFLFFLIWVFFVSAAVVLSFQVDKPCQKPKNARCHGHRERRKAWTRVGAPGYCPVMTHIPPVRLSFCGRYVFNCSISLFFRCWPHLCGNQTTKWAKLISPLRPRRAWSSKTSLELKR